jgi:hypothetical protein
MTSDSALRRYFRHWGVSGRGSDRRECAAATSSRLVHRRRRAQHLRQLGDVGGDAPGLVAGEEVCSRAPGAALSDPAGGGLSFPSQQHPPIKIVGPTVTMAWPPMGVPAAASSVSSETSQKKSSSVWSSSAVTWFMATTPLFETQMTLPGWTRREVTAAVGAALRQRCVFAADLQLHGVGCVRYEPN